MKTIVHVSEDIALLISRLIIGGIFIFTGWMKVSDMTTTISFFNSLHIPLVFTYLVAYGELIGGILLVLGLWVECASLFLTIVMLVAVYLTKEAGPQVFMTPLSMLAGLVAILGCGAGRYKVNFF